MSEPVISVTNIKKRFGDLEVLHGLSLDAHKGDVISLIGSSGSGKSTFLRCINLLEMPDEGEVSLNGEAIAFAHKKGQRTIAKQSQVQHFRSKIGMVFQQFNLWAHLTILDNVAQAPIRVLKMDKKAAQASAMNYLEKVGIAEKAHFYPSQLSGGQQQRVAIARALAMQPEAILFDEPTSALDPELVSEVLVVMKQLAEEGATMIVVTHEMAFARDVANKALFLHQGLIEESGDPQQLFHSPKSERLQQFLAKTAIEV